MGSSRQLHSHACYTGRVPWPIAVQGLVQQIGTDTSVVFLSWDTSLLLRPPLSLLTLGQEALLTMPGGPLGLAKLSNVMCSDSMRLWSCGIVICFITYRLSLE